MDVGELSLVDLILAGADVWLLKDPGRGWGSGEGGRSGIGHGDGSGDSAGAAPGAPSAYGTWGSRMYPTGYGTGYGRLVRKGSGYGVGEGAAEEVWGTFLPELLKEYRWTWGSAVDASALTKRS